MTKTLRFAAVLLSIVGVSIGARAATVSPYTVDFNTAIDVADHAFKVASNWKHVVGSYTDNYGDTYYMSYGYKPTQGRDGSGALYCPRQEAGDGWDTNDVKDYLVTPVVSGEVSLWVKNYYTGGYVEFYAMNDDGTVGSSIKKFSSTAAEAGDPTLNDTDFTQVTITLDEPARVAIRANYVYIDDFSAASAEIEAEGALKIASFVPSETTGTQYWNQLPDGTVPITFTVTVENTGDVDYAVGDAKYSISLINSSTKAVLAAPVKIPQDLKRGETSAEFECKFVIPADQLSTVFTNSYSGTKMSLRENVSQSMVNLRPALYRKYANAFVFREAGTYTSSSLSKEQNMGVLTGPASLNFEIINYQAAAPLHISAITVPEGFTVSALPAEGIDLASDDKFMVTVTATAATPGNFAGNIEVTYNKITTDGEAETVYTLPIKANVVGANTWVADFNNTSSTPNYPLGSVAENGINSDYNYISSNNYNNYLKSYTSSDYKTADNKFISPLLHAAAGATISFDFGSNSDSNADSFVRLYLSKDRVDWGEPIAEVLKADMTSDWKTATATVPAEGDYYVGVAIYRAKVDNIVGLDKIQSIIYDVYYRKDNLDEQYQSGTTINATVTVIPARELVANDYEVSLYANGQKVASAAGTAVAASAKNTKEFKLTWTPTVETTTTFATYFQFNFIDGTTIATPTKNVTITNEPLFYFINAGATTGNYPTSRKDAISFGRVNEVGLTQKFEIYNHGTAPLSVSSITVPAGFSVSATEATVAAKERQELDVTFSATEMGSYSGDIALTWTDGAGQQQTFTLPISATLLDPTKWYATFNNPSDPNKAAWPAGSLYQKNINVYYTGSYANPDQYLSCASATDNMFITPKLRAAANDQISFDAAIYSTGWKEGTVSVYAAATREGLAQADTRTELGVFSGQNVDEAHTMTVERKTFAVTIPEAGEYYIGFAITGRASLDEIYGLELVNVGPDLIVDASAPQSAMQNVPATATVSVLNIGLSEIEANTYTVTAYVGDKATATTEVPALPMANILTAARTEVPVTLRHSKVGTFPVHFEVKVGDYTVATEPVDVTFTPEELSAEKQVGKNEAVSNDFVNFYYKFATGAALYTPEDLGLNDGDKISAISFRGYMAGDNTKEFHLYYAFTDDTELTAPANGKYDTAGMTELISNPAMDFKKGDSSESNHVTLISATPSEPIVYPAGKSMLIVAYATAAKYAKMFLETAATNGNAYCHGNDNESTFLSQAWNATKLPVMYLTLEVEPVSLSGTVTKVDGTAAASAVVTLTSRDADGVQYEATTDADGNYSVNVIQSSRSYDATATQGALFDAVKDLTFAQSLTENFTVMPKVTITNESAELVATEKAYLTVALDFPAGVSTVALPFDVDADQAAALFGPTAKVHKFAGDDGNAPYAEAQFSKVETLAAGVPYMLHLDEAFAGEFTARGAKVIDEAAKSEGQSIDFVGVFTQTTLPDDAVIIDGMEVETTPAAAPVNGGARAAATVEPFHAYFVARPGFTLANVDVKTDSGLVTGVEDVITETNGDDAVYNLQGVRVSNPTRGVYIVNGKKVFIK